MPKRIHPDPGVSRWDPAPGIALAMGCRTSKNG